MSSTEGPTRFIIHSPEGWGKTTVLAHFDDTIIAGNERGIPRDLPFSVATMHLDSWEGVLDFVDSLRRDRHPFRHVGFDTLDWIEPMIHRFVCARDTGRKTEMNPGAHELISIEDYGWSKGYIVAEEEFRKFLRELDQLQHERGMHISFAMHSHVVTFKNPAGPDFDRWEPKCHKRVARSALEWGENVFFGHFDTVAGKIPSEEKAKKDAARPKGVGGDRRLIATTHTAMWDAKNRHRLPPIIEVSDPRALIPLITGAHLQKRTTPEGWTSPQIGSVPATSEPNNVVPFTRSTQPAQSSTNGHADSRTWTEPSRPEPADTTDRRATHGTPTASAQASATPATQHDLDQRQAMAPGMRADVKDALDRAQHARGIAYVRKVEDWLTRADTDDKIKKVIEKVNKDLAGNAPA